MKVNWKSVINFVITVLTAVLSSFCLLPKAILASRSVWTVWTNSFIWSRYCLRSISGISPTQRHHYITSSYTYQFFEKNYIGFLIAVSLCTCRHSNEEFILFKSHRLHRFTQISLDLCGLGGLRARGFRWWRRSFEFFGIQWCLILFLFPIAVSLCTCRHSNEEYFFKHSAFYRREIKSSAVCSVTISTENQRLPKSFRDAPKW